MSDLELLRFLHDKTALIDAYTASSAYVMRKAFKQIAFFKKFKKRKDLAVKISQNYQTFLKKRLDPVILNAHVYALELTGEKVLLGKLSRSALRHKHLKVDPLVGQFIGYVGTKHFRPRVKVEPDKFFKSEELQNLIKHIK